MVRLKHRTAPRQRVAIAREAILISSHSANRTEFFRIDVKAIVDHFIIHKHVDHAPITTFPAPGANPDSSTPPTGSHTRNTPGSPPAAAISPERSAKPSNRSSRIHSLQRADTSPAAATSLAYDSTDTLTTNSPVPPSATGLQFRSVSLSPPSGRLAGQKATSLDWSRSR